MNSGGFIPIEQNSVYFLYRRGYVNHIQAMYDHGEIYMNTIDFIRQCDENEERTDPHDGITKRVFLGDVKVKMCNVGSDIDQHGIPMDGKNCVMISDTVEKGNIFCLSGLYSDHFMGDREDIEFDTKAFGESLIFISNPKEFLHRIVAALNSAGYADIKYQPVLYYPNEYSGSTGIFRKHFKYKDQNEFRIFVPNVNNEPISISIGPLHDIAKVGGSEMLKLTYTDGKEQIIRIT